MAGELVARTVELFYNGTWNDITQYVHDRDAFRISRGVANEGGSADPATLSLTLNNRDGRFSPRNPSSPLYGLIGRNTPIRVSAGLEGGTQTVRFVGEVTAWPARWDVSGRDVWVPLQAAGILRRVGVPDTPLHSPLWRTIMAQPGLLGYWPLEDGEGALWAASAVPGVTPARVRPTVRLGQDPVSPGSGPSALVTADVSADALPITCRVPDATQDGWAVESVFRIPDDTADGLIWRMSVRDETGAAWRVEATLADPDLTITLTWFPSFVDEPGTSTQLASESIKRGSVHQIRIGAVEAVGRNWLLVADGTLLDSATASGASAPTAVGRATQVGISAAGLLCGHVAVYEFAADVPPGLTTSTHLAVGGWDGEPAVSRLIRLCMEEGLSPDVRGRQVAADTFTRSETDSWGAPDQGPGWVTHGTASSFAVVNGEGTITDQSGGSGEAATLGAIGNMSAWYTNVDMRVRTNFDQDGQVGLIARCESQTAVAAPLQAGYYSFEVSDVSGVRAVNLWRIDLAGEDVTKIATAGDPGEGPWWMRVVCAGPWLLCKVWQATDDEPAGWTLTAYDTRYGRGVVGCIHFGLGGSGSFDDFSLSTLDESTRCGPQRQETLVSALNDAAAVEAGGGWAPILTERRDARGLRITTRAALYNRPADLELDYQSGHISEPFEPLPDDRNAANDVTVTRQGGTGYRKVRTAGPLNISDPADDPEGMGPVTRSLRLDLHSDGQVSEVAGWMLLHGTWDEERFPVIRLDMRSLSTRTPDVVADVAALLEGHRVTVDNLPAWMPPGLVDQVVLGIAETITQSEWTVDLHLAPYGPYRVGVWQEVGATPDPDAPARYSPEDSVTAAQFTAGTDTSLMVTDQTGDHDLWTTDAGAYPLDILVSGVRLRVTAASGASSPQTLTVAQTPVNGVTKTIPAGSKVELWSPARYAL